MIQPVPLFYRELGPKGNPPLMILHGFLGMSDNWMSFGKRMAGKFHVVIPDLRNHGLSAHSDFFGFDEMKADLLTLMDSLNLDNVNILGHSMGGRLSMMLAVSDPARISSLLVADMSPFHLPEDTSHLELLKIMQEIHLPDFGTLNEIEHTLRKSIEEDRLVLFCLKNIRRSTEGYYDWKPNVEILAEQAWKLKMTVPEGRPFPGRVKFIAGGRSPYFSAEEWPDILKIFPKAEYKIIEGAGHWVHVDSPDIFYEETIKFLQ